MLSPAHPTGGLQASPLTTRRFNYCGPQVPETLSQEFAFCLDPYLTFLYQYDGGDVQDVVPEAIEEFFMDWLLRKVMVKPPEYTQWPSTLRLFYRFLADKGYLADPEPIIAALQAIEPAFIALVKQRS